MLGGHSGALGPTELGTRDRRQEAPVELLFEGDDALELVEEPAVDAGDAMDLGGIPASPHGLEERREAIGCGDREALS